jgi:hypothetical protein
MPFEAVIWTLEDFIGWETVQLQVWAATAILYKLDVGYVVKHNRVDTMRSLTDILCCKE